MSHSDSNATTDAAVEPALSTAPSGGLPAPDMLWIPGRHVRHGLRQAYPEERPVHRVTVDGFWLDRTPVTNERFARFVAETGHTTFAEIPPNPDDYPGALPEMLYPARSSSSSRPARSTSPTSRNWWQYKRGADWRHPYGPDSSIDGLEQHPVVHVTFGDAEAFATVGGQEPADRSRVGVRRPRRARRRARMPGATSSCPMTGTWPTPGRASSRGTPRQGRLRGHVPGRRSFPPNGYGAVDMIGNVWEWTTDWFVPRHPERRSQGLLHSEEPARAGARAQLRPAPAGDQDPAQGAEGRLASVRAELLPALPAGGALPGAGRHLDVPRRIPLHRPARRQGALTWKRPSSSWRNFLGTAHRERRRCWSWPTARSKPSSGSSA